MATKNNEAERLKNKASAAQNSAAVQAAKQAASNVRVAQQGNVGVSAAKQSNLGVQQKKQTDMGLHTPPQGTSGIRVADGQSRWHMPDWETNPAGKFFRSIGGAMDRWRDSKTQMGGVLSPPEKTPNYSLMTGAPSSIPQGARSAISGNIPGPRVENKPGYTDRKAPVGIGADPTNQQTPASIAAQKAAQPGQNSQSPTGNRYLDMAQYGNNPLMNNLTMPATEENKKRFMEMGGIQTIRGTMKPDERPSVGWWNPNTLREHATIGEGMMGVDYPVAAQRYGIDAPVQGKVAEAGIKAAADVATTQPKSPWEFKTMDVPDPNDPLGGNTTKQGVWVNKETQEVRPAETPPPKPPAQDVEAANKLAGMPESERDDFLEEYANANKISVPQALERLRLGLEWAKYGGR